MAKELLVESRIAARQGRERRGFTLTEIAIVLGIIGLILGAIWVAAAAVYNNRRISTTSTQLLSITQAVRSLYSTSPTIGDAAGTNESLNFCKAGVFPTDMVTSPCAAGAPATDQWGTAVTVTSQTVAVTGDSFGIEFGSVPQNACISLLTANTGAGRDPGLWYASASAAAKGATSYAPAAQTVFPLSAATAATDCAVTTAAGNYVQFVFNLKG